MRGHCMYYTEKKVTEIKIMGLWTNISAYAFNRLARSTEGLFTSILVSLRIVSKYSCRAPSSCWPSRSNRRCVA